MTLTKAEDFACARPPRRKIDVVKLAIWVAGAVLPRAVMIIVARWMATVLTWPQSSLATLRRCREAHLGLTAAAPSAPDRRHADTQAIRPTGCDERRQGNDAGPAIAVEPMAVHVELGERVEDNKVSDGRCL